MARVELVPWVRRMLRQESDKGAGAENRSARHSDTGRAGRRNAAPIAHFFGLPASVARGHAANRQRLAALARSKAIAASKERDAQRSRTRALAERNRLVRAAEREGAKLERARMQAIIQSPEGAANPVLAIALATRSSLDPDEAKEVLDAATAGDAARSKGGLGFRMALVRTPNPGSDASHLLPDGSPQPAAAAIIRASRIARGEHA